jgi:hypothetical protein
VWIVATETRARMTGNAVSGPPFDADTFKRKLAHDRWQAWWTANQQKLHFDSASGEWSVG